MRDQKKADEIAEQRVQILSPLLAEGLDSAQARQIKARICEQTGISERTVNSHINPAIILKLKPPNIGSLALTFAN